MDQPAHGGEYTRHQPGARLAAAPVAVVRLMCLLLQVVEILIKNVRVIFPDLKLRPTAAAGEQRLEESIAAEQEEEEESVEPRTDGGEVVVDAVVGSELETNDDDGADVVDSTVAMGEQTLVGDASHEVEKPKMVIVKRKRHLVETVVVMDDEDDEEREKRRRISTDIADAFETSS